MVDVPTGWLVSLREGETMTRTDLDTLEDLLVDVATAGGHIDIAMRCIQHGNLDRAVVELRDALVLTHKIKLHVMAVRWMSAPNTFQDLIRKQVSWLKNRYGV
jgi:hypothetical protein